MLSIICFKCWDWYNRHIGIVLEINMSIIIDSIKQLFRKIKHDPRKSADLQTRLDMLMVKHGAIRAESAGRPVNPIHERLNDLIAKHSFRAASVPVGAMLGGAHLPQSGFNANPDDFIAKFGGHSSDMVGYVDIFSNEGGMQAAEEFSDSSWHDQGHYDTRANGFEMNPATGLPMFGLLDVAGNPYGCSSDMTSPFLSSDSSTNSMSDELFQSGVFDSSEHSFSDSSSSFSSYD